MLFAFTFAGNEARKKEKYMNMLAKNRNNDLMRFHQASQPFEELVKSVFNYFPGFRSELLFGSAIDSKLEIDAREDEVKLHLPAPGCKSGDFEIEAVGDFVTIKVCKRDEKSEHGHKEEKCTCHYICKERVFSEYEESIKVPVNVDGSKAVAKYEDGILTVTLPRLKPESKKIKQIVIN